MESWVVARCPSDEGDYILKNPSRTLIRFSERTSPDVEKLMSEMVDLNVPFSYADRVKEIYFTYLPSTDYVTHGDHFAGRIRINFGSESRDIAARILVHELGHNLDDEEGISERPDILEEKKRRARYLPDPSARRNVAEYVAIGFETYYCGTPAEKRRMRRCNPRLYWTINYLHRKHKAR